MSYEIELLYMLLSNKARFLLRMEAYMVHTDIRSCRPLRDTRKRHDHLNRGMLSNEIFSLCVYIRNLKTPPQKPLALFESFFSINVHWVTLFRNCEFYFGPYKAWPQGLRLIFLIYVYLRNSLKPQGL